jgi:hypothetical protein
MRIRGALFLIAVSIFTSSCGGINQALLPAPAGTPSAAPTQTAPVEPPITLYAVKYGETKLHAFHLDEQNGLVPFVNSPFLTIGLAWTATVTPKNAGLLLTHYAGEGHQDVAYVPLDNEGVPQTAIDRVLPRDAFVGDNLLFHPNGKFLYGLSYAEPAVRVFAVNGDGSYTEDVAAKFSLGTDCPTSNTYLFYSAGVTPEGSLVVSTQCYKTITILATDPQTGHIVKRTDLASIPLSSFPSMDGVVMPSSLQKYVMWTATPVGETKRRTILWEIKDGELVELASCTDGPCSSLQVVAVGPNASGGFGIDADGAVVALVREGGTLIPKRSSVVIAQPYFKGMQVSEDGRYVIVLSESMSPEAKLNVLRVASDGSLAHVPGSPFASGIFTTDAVAIIK